MIVKRHVTMNLPFFTLLQVMFRSNKVFTSCVLNSSGAGPPGPGGPPFLPPVWPFVSDARLPMIYILKYFN